MKKDLCDFYNEESITIIEDFCTYYKSDDYVKNTYTNSFRHFSELLKKNDLKSFSIEDYNKLQTTKKSGHAKQIFRFLYAKKIIKTPKDFLFFGTEQDILDRLEKGKHKLNQPKELKEDFIPAITTQNLDKLISYINKISKNDYASLKLAFCFHLLFYECVPVNVIKNIKLNDYEDGFLFIRDRRDRIVVPKVYRFIWEDVGREKRFRGFSSLNDSIDQLCINVGLEYLTPEMINDASIQRFIRCPECGKRYLGSTGNWVGINSYLVCNGCSKKYIVNGEKKKIVEQLTNYPVDFSKYAEEISNNYRTEDDLSGDDIIEFNSFNVKNPRTKKVIIERLVRETKFARELKVKYHDQCQVCGKKTRCDKDGFMSEGHHLKPYNCIHQGDDLQANMIVLCPNHHAQFDRLYYAIEPETHLIHCQYKYDENNLKKIILEPGHVLGEAYVQYVWVKFCELARKAE